METRKVEVCYGGVARNPLAGTNSNKMLAVNETMSRISSKSRYSQTTIKMARLNNTLMRAWIREENVDSTHIIMSRKVFIDRP